MDEKAAAYQSHNLSPIHKTEQYAKFNIDKRVVERVTFAEKAKTDAF